MAEKLSETKKTKNGKNDQAYQIRKLTKAVEFLVHAVKNLSGGTDIKRWEKATGFDLDKDGKIGMTKLGVLAMILMVCLTGAVVHAVDLIDVEDNDTSRTTVWQMDGDGDGTATAVLTGTLTVSEAITASSGVVSTKSSVTVTDSGTLTVTGGNMNVNPIGQASGLTNTVTLANATDGLLTTIVVASGSTNDLKVADSGIAKLSADFIGNDDDTLTLIGVGTNWIEVSRSAN